MSPDNILELLNSVESESTCIKRQVGAVLVDESGEIISIETNGSKEYPCTDSGICKRSDSPSGFDLENCAGYDNHAEVETLKVIPEDIDMSSYTLYVSCSPCPRCAEYIIKRGVGTVLYRDDYGDMSGVQILKDHSVKVGVI